MNLNTADIMKGLKDMQGRMAEIQNSLQSLESEGNAGGGLVTVRMNGKMEITKVKIDPIAVDPGDIKMLEELIVSASAAAMNKIQAEIKEKMTSMGMPAGFPGLSL